MITKNDVLNGITILAGCCAILVAGNAAWRGDFSLRSVAAPTDEKPVPVPGFERLLASGHRIGPEEAILTIVEFGDFECAACSIFAKVIDTLRSKHPRDIALVWHHLPLPYHHLAYPLARGAECAAAQNRFKEFYSAAFAYQRELGIITVAELGPRAGVLDTAAFSRCARDTSRVPAIEADLAIARDIKVPGTPGIIMDGMLYPMAGMKTVKDFETILSSKRP